VLLVRRREVMAEADITNPPDDGGIAGGEGGGSGGGDGGSGGGDAGTGDAGTGDAGSTTDTLTNDQAVDLLDAANIRVQSTGNCSDRNNAACTSLDGVRRSTIDGIINFQRNSGADIIITGGTEVGQNLGIFSQGNGFKLDISRTNEVTDYLHNNFANTGTRADGAALYQDVDGNVYALTFRLSGPTRTSGEVP
jgi:hypothetical protein